MKYFTSFVLLVFLGFASPQTFNGGRCNPHIRTMNHFDENKFAGRWYGIQKSQSVAQDDTKCNIYPFELRPREDYRFLVPSTYIYTANGEIHQSLLYHVGPEHLYTGKLWFTPGFIADKQSFWVLETDYQEYAVMYTCLDSYNGKLEYVWFHSKNPRPKKATFTKVQKILYSRNINVPLFTENEGC